MGLGVWLIEDVRAKLLAVNEAVNELEALGPFDAKSDYIAGYRRGYRAALKGVALAFGIAPTILGGNSGQDATRQGEGIREVGESTASGGPWKISRIE